jgi:hypothetical protein
MARPQSFVHRYGTWIIAIVLLLGLLHNFITPAQWDGFYLAVIKPDHRPEWLQFKPTPPAPAWKNPRTFQFEDEVGEKLFAEFHATAERLGARCDGYTTQGTRDYYLKHYCFSAIWQRKQDVTGTPLPLHANTPPVPTNATTFPVSNGGLFEDMCKQSLSGIELTVNQLDHRIITGPSLRAALFDTQFGCRATIPYPSFDTKKSLPYSLGGLIEFIDHKDFNSKASCRLAFDSKGSSISIRNRNSHYMQIQLNDGVYGYRLFTQPKALSEANNLRACWKDADALQTALLIELQEVLEDQSQRFHNPTPVPGTDLFFDSKSHVPDTLFYDQLSAEDREKLFQLAQAQSEEIITQHNDFVRKNYRELHRLLQQTFPLTECLDNVEQRLNR